MDEPATRLSLEERALVDGLSEDLYSVGVDRAVQEAMLPEAAEDYSRAEQTGDNGAILRVLRKFEAAIPAAEVAKLRGICWSRLAEHNAAAVFFVEGVRCAPQDPQAHALLLNCWLRANADNDAAAHAERLLNEGRMGLVSVIAAKAILAARLPASASGDEARIRSIRVIEREMARHAQRPPDEFEHDVWTFALLLLASVYEAQGQLGDAMRVCVKALEFAPECGDALALRTHLESRMNLDDAASALRHVIEVHDSARLDVLPHVAIGTNP